MEAAVSAISFPSGFVAPIPAPARPAVRPELLKLERSSADSQVAGDRRLVERCRSGDGGAYRELVEQNQSQIASMMWRFSRDPETHEDLVQDVFVEAYSHLRSYRGEAPFSHWLAGIATRIGYQYWKRQKRARAIEAGPVEDWDAIADESADEMHPEHAGELLHKLLTKLPPRDGLVLTLRYVENLSVEETAKRAGWSQVMVKVQALRAKKKLKALFATAEERGL